VKPSSILLDAGGEVFLADFGIARGPDTPWLSAPDCILGSSGYLASEQSQGWDACPATDVHALGLVRIEAVAGHRDYDGIALDRTADRLVQPRRIPGAPRSPVVLDLGGHDLGRGRRAADAARAGELLAVCSGRGAAIVGFPDRQ
jgi:serine/threonine protein kinase